MDGVTGVTRLPSTRVPSTRLPSSRLEGSLEAETALHLGKGEGREGGRKGGEEKEMKVKVLEVKKVPEMRRSSTMGHYRVRAGKKLHSMAHTQRHTAGGHRDLETESADSLKN